VADLTSGSWWAAAGPAVRIVTPRPDTRSSTARSGPAGTVEVRLSTEQLTAATVVHELAHALAGVADGHGALFRAAAADLAAMVAGAATGARLETAFDALGLAVAARRWPSPWRYDGATFRVVP
jgi:hypothetical protein